MTDKYFEHYDREMLYGEVEWLNDEITRVRGSHKIMFERKQEVIATVEKALALIDRSSSARFEDLSPEKQQQVHESTAYGNNMAASNAIAELKYQMLNEGMALLRALIK